MAKRCVKEGCKAWAISSDDYCFTHSEKPEIVEKRKRAVAKGGRRSRKYPIVKEQLPGIYFELKSLKDLSSFMETVINGAMQNTMTLKKANTLGYLSNIMKGILVDSELDERLKKLESEVYARG